MIETKELLFRFSESKTSGKKFDITPTPKILRALGEIPFSAWQCIAELADNALDEFRDAEKDGCPIPNARLDIIWSSEDTPASEREVIIIDNGRGMPLEALQNAARAGFSGNDPINNLGLFGMGFNISTARLGDETIFLSATTESPEWTGISINFDTLIANHNFEAPDIVMPKKKPTESGTMIIIRRLNEGLFQDLKTKESAIRRRLESIYSPILENGNVEIRVQNKILKARNHCVWGETRFVIHNNEKVAAKRDIEFDLGSAWFDQNRNRYLSAGEEDSIEDIIQTGGTPPEGIIKRSRRLKGWIGIQRFSDPSEFGIDFVRNGRKILIGDKSLFSFENPDTGTQFVDYPVELGSTVGGRIVGELHVDYLVPTYQKNGFDVSGKPWRMTLEAIRGIGPLLPKRRASFGFQGGNTSPLGRLVNAFRRNDPGTRNLALPREVASNFLEEFRKGTLDFQNDDKWFKAAQEQDKIKGGEDGQHLPPVDSGDLPTDNPEDYAPNSTPLTNLAGDNSDPTQTHSTAKPSPFEHTSKASTAPTPLPQTASTSESSELLGRSDKVVSMSGQYRYSQEKAPFLVTVWKIKSGQIKKNSKRAPYMIFQDGVEVDFFFDENHFLIEEYPITPKQILLQVISERFGMRDALPIQDVFLALVENHLADERINLSALRERAESIFNFLRELLPNHLKHRLLHCIKFIKDVPAERDALCQSLLEEAPELLQLFQEELDGSEKVLSFVSWDSLIRLVENMPEEFLDNKIFRMPYSSISIGDNSSISRLQKMSLDKVVSYLKDVKSLVLTGGKPSKPELIRHANTLMVLEDRLSCHS